MTRAIDYEIAKKRLQAWIDESEAQGFEEAARNFRDCISLLDAVPTLTPPNEPLTCEGCACEEYRRDTYPCNCCARNDETISDQYRPPERQEDT